jgi:uncharacterized protein (DUF433 family)
MIIAYANTPALPVIGEGIFLTKDIAQILHLPYSKVRNWRSEIWDKKLSKVTGKEYSIGEDRYKAVNFYTLIEFYTFYKLREKGVSAQKISKAHGIISKDLNSPYPFAISGIATDGKKIWYNYLENIINADGSRQINIRPIIEPFLDKIDFDKKNRLALRFYPLGKKNKVVVDPAHQFGQPIITGTNIKAKIIYHLHRGGETIKGITKLYDISPKNVSDAIGFYQKRA